jgi:cyanophycin synthetase
MHLAPSFGKPRPLGEAIIDTLFPDGHNGRIPTVAVTGTNGKTTTVRLITHLLAQTGLTVGMTNTDGVFVGSQQTDSGDCSGPKSARSVLLHPDAQAAVFEVARGGLLREGMGFDRCEVGIITNIGQGDHIGLNFIESAEDVAAIKSVVARNVSTTGVAVLNANDPLCVAMADDCPGAVTFFGDDAHHPVIAAHRAKGQRVVFVDGDAIIAAQGNAIWRFALADIPLTRGGRIGFQIANAMAAIAAAWALKMDWAVLRRGLASFVSDAGSAPGRFNVFEWRGATIIADYGHNPDAIQALVDAVAALPAERRSVVISGDTLPSESLRRQTQGADILLHEALQPSFKDYAQQIVRNAKVLADTLTRDGLRITSGGTDNHLMLVDLRARSADLTGADAEKWLEKAGVIVNKNGIPNDTRPPMVTSGLRLGTPALTTRGLKEAEMELVAAWIDRVLGSSGDAATITAVRGEIRSFCGKFPLFH